MSASDPMQSPQGQREPELLSPAGNWDCVRAAVANGADAVFFGLPTFNARLRADNFTDDDLPELMDFLHAHGVRGFVTMNTLIFTGELEAAEAQLRLLDRCRVDAIIVQDLGLARLARSVAPSLEIHASTQMTITSPEGLQFADQLFQLDRAVLARELSLQEIGKFDPTECVPLEVFVHGALCVAYSGQCLTSESLGQRSANRGECAQACRMPYTLVVDGEERDMDEVRYLLSPQDLAAVDLIPDLVQQGVVSYKIEGRLKSPEYVAAITRVYRKAIDAAVAEKENPVTAEDRYTMEMAFSRGLSTGWLEGTNHPRLTHGKFGKKRGVYLGEVTGCERGWVEVKLATEIPVKAGDGVVFDAGENRDHEQGARVWEVKGDRFLFHRDQSGLDWKRIEVGQKIWKTDDPKLNQTLKASWKNAKLEPLRDTLDITVTGAVGQAMTLSAAMVTVTSSEILESAQTRPLTTEFLENQLGRLGGTRWQLGCVTNDLIGAVMIPVSAVNRLRRALVESLDAQTREPAARIEPKGSLADLLPARESDESSRRELSALCRSMEQIESCLEAGVANIYVDFEDIKRGREAVALVRQQKGARIHLATPRIQKSGEAGFFKVIERAEPDGVLIRNLGGISYFKGKTDLYQTGDFSLNCANPVTAQILREEGGLDHLTISYDLNVNQVLDLLVAAPTDWFELTLHQHMPMFHMEHCVFCTFMSEGTSILDCGKPCEKHHVQMKDRVGQLHTLKADVGCRNTLFNGLAQTGARFYQQMRGTGLRRFRVDFLDEDAAAATQTLRAYQQLLAGETSGQHLWQDLDVMEKLGVTEGTLEVKR
ncbi:MAG: U32 family peptidase [Verrucomicrobiae bacterium]|nr:U32 family peptidase [Verrucomicrobiae bacterium]NNJ44286.1 U32 family peptidase [Akkermansiaceae bacterium]